MTSTITIAVIDYGMGNLRSVSKALEHVAEGQRVFLTQEPERVLAADRVVFPGQGAIGGCMAELKRRGLVQAVVEAARSKPFLGICLGPQALMEYSEENDGTAGLGVFPGRVLRFPADLAEPDTGVRLKIPHMGWNQVHQARDHFLWRDIPQDSRFYFVHSYYLQPAAPELTSGVTCYGMRFASALARDNVFAVQFHPEKSQRAGLTLLANFVRWGGAA